MQKSTLFPTCVYSAEIEEAKDLNALLAGDILAWREADPGGKPRSNRNRAWHSTTDAFARPAFAEITKAVLGAATEVFVAEGYAPKTRTRLTEMWANVSENGGYHVPHIHTDCLWSGVYHVTAPEGAGALVFLDPRGPAPHMEGAAYAKAWEDRPETWEVSRFPARPGQMVLFPSWFMHQVEPHDGIEPRISISFNISQIVPPQVRAPETPAYVVVPQVLTRDEITRLYAQLGDRPFGAAAVGEGHVRPSIRNNRVVFADGKPDDSPWHWLYEKLAHHAEIVNRETYGMDISDGGQPIQFSRYGPGQKYEEHQDVYEDKDGTPEGRRSLSCVVVLRNAERGGGTMFPRAAEGAPHQSPGDAVFFRADERHAARTVEAGVRDTAVIWFCKRAG